MTVVTSPLTTGAPYDRMGTFSLRIEDAVGRQVPGVKIAFSWPGAVGFLLSPYEATTDSTGVATTTVTMGTTAGRGTLTATPAGVNIAPISLEMTITPGPPITVELVPQSLRLFAAGDTASFTARVLDAYGNVIPDARLTFQATDPTLLDVTAPGTLGERGFIRALRGGGGAVVAANVVGELGRTGSIGVTVFEKARTACSGVAPAQPVPLGQLFSATSSTFCIERSTTDVQYALIAYNASTDGSASRSTLVTGYNVVAGPPLPPSLTAQAPVGGASTLARTATRSPTWSRAAALLQRASAPRLDLQFHERLLTRSRSLRTLFAQARATRGRGAAGGISAARLSSAGSSTSVPQVDALVALNVATEACSSGDVRTFRVEAIGTNAIILADTANPAGGFTRTDYQRFASRFDSLVFPVDVGAFGAPTDIDGNGRVAILFTRAVNELTPAGADAFVGGFFHPRDLFPRGGAASIAACPTSNEGEMFYMLVPDAAGAVNGNRFPLGMVDTLTTGVLAHEFQHLINAGRRMYVNTAAQEFEETWLNEGLSHIAEELLYFRESGYRPRSRLSTQSIYASQTQWNTWVADESSNFVRFFLYLSDPAKHSPIDVGDELETRGATWAFLRYAVDQQFSDDAVWQRFGNATTTGLATLEAALGDPQPLLRDFAVANLVGPLLGTRYLHPSWNFADVYTRVFTLHEYPRPFEPLYDATPASVTVRGGSASYYRFTVPAKAEALFQVGSAQVPASSDLSFMLVRLNPLY